MSSNNVMKWNEKVHEDVLIAVNVSQLPRADWDRIMASLRDMGYTFTESALRYVSYYLEGCPYCRPH